MPGIPRTKITILLLIATLWAGVACAQQEHAVPEDMNRRFVDPELDVDTWVQRFEGESREVFAARDAILTAAALKKGDRVADVGAGTGLYTRLFAAAVGPKGRVYAVDISPVFLSHINETALAAGLDNVTSVLGRLDSATLPRESVDVAFVCDTYHHFDAPGPMLASMRDALVPGGRLIVVDFDRVEGKSRQWVLDHVRAGKAAVRAEIEAAGFAFVADEKIEGLDENFFLVFKKK